MFEKAQRKVEEVRFFAGYLRRADLSADGVEFYLGALLNAGNKVTYALRAEAGEAFQPVLASWRKTIAEEELDLFNLFQEIRDVEVHEKDGRIEILPIPKEAGRQELVRMTSNPTTRASYATLQAMGILKAMREVPSYELVVQLPPGGRAKRREIEQLFQRVRARRPLEIAGDCSRYADLLAAEVSHFEGACSRTTPTQTAASGDGLPRS